MKFCGFVFFAGAGLLFAQPAPEGDIRTNSIVISSEYVSRLIAEARTNNPSLRAADSKVRSASLNAESIRNWEDPAAIFGGSVYSSKGFKASEDGDLAYGVEQKLPLWNRPKLARQVARTDVSMREAEADYRFRQLRDDITKALLRAALAERIVEIGQQDPAW